MTMYRLVLFYMFYSVLNLHIMSFMFIIVLISTNFVIVLLLHSLYTHYHVYANLGDYIGCLGWAKTFKCILSFRYIFGIYDETSLNSVS